MKKFICIFLLILTSTAFLAAEADSDTGLKIKIAETMKEFSQAYLEVHPAPVTKQGIAVMVIENNSEKATIAKIGELVRAYLEEAMDRSLIFVLTDRANLDRILEEIKFSASGMVSDGSAVEIGEITGTAALVSGSVSEEGPDFRIQLKLTEIESGEVLTVFGFSLPQKDLIDASTEYEYGFVAANGIGLSAKPLMYLYGASTFNKGKPIYVDITAKYRISRELMISGGMMTNITGDGDIYRWDGTGAGEYGGTDVTYTEAQPDLPFTPAIPEFDQITGALTTAFAPHLDFQYTINFAPVFNIGINLGVLGFFEPVLEVLYGGNDNSIYYSGTGYSEVDGSEEADGVALKDSVPMQYVFESTFGAKIEICPEFFITHRIALTGVIGYLYTFPSPLRGVSATQGEWGYYAEALASGFGADAVEKYYGFDPINAPGGGSWALDFSGLYAGIALSIFF